MRIGEYNMTHIPRRVLVTEAAGSVGRATLDLLARRQMKATGLGLRDPGGLPLDRMVVGSAGDPEVVRRAPVGAKAVIHLAALPALGPAWTGTMLHRRTCPVDEEIPLQVEDPPPRRHRGHHPHSPRKAKVFSG
ncbi:hypothetical protein GCM10020220_023190 [Nonomuraea rubra]